MKKSDKDSSKKKPLLYIAQPKFKVPAISMQKSFRIRRDAMNIDATEKQEGTDQTELVPSKFQVEGGFIFKEELEVVNPSAAKGAVLEVSNSSVEGEVEPEPDYQEVQQGVISLEQESLDDVKELDVGDVEEEAVGDKTEELIPVVRKPFRDMDTEEKILYLLHRPHYIPKVLCEVQAENGTHVGYIVSFENGVVVVRTQAQFFLLNIPLNDIIDIQIRALR